MRTVRLKGDHLALAVAVPVRDLVLDHPDITVRPSRLPARRRDRVIDRIAGHEARPLAASASPA
jgi:hypothetical protein